MFSHYRSQRELPDEPPAAMPIAMNLLARRDYTAQQIQNKLQQRGCTAEDIADAIARCFEQGWLDHLRYAESYVRGKAAQGYGAIRIGNELKQKGVATTDIEIALQQEIDWWHNAQQQRLKKHPAGLAMDYKQKSKLYRFLMYRGFDSEQIQFALTDPD